MKHDQNLNNEFIEFDDILMNVGSILQVIPNSDWDWTDYDHKEKRNLFVIHFLGGGSLKFPMDKFEEFKKLLIK